MQVRSHMPDKTKPFLYSLSKPSQDQTLEDDLVRTLRFRYTRRNNTKDNASKIKWIKIAIKELRTYRRNRDINPEKCEYYDKQYIKASNVNVLRLNFTEEYERNEKLIRDAYFQLTWHDWHSTEIVPTPKNAQQISLLDETS